MKDDPRGKTAVVTGASSGIGLCFCRDLASRGCNLMMVSNEREALEKCAAEISGEFGVKAIPFYCDLTASDCASQILGFTDSENITPDYLINDAGIFSFRPVTETPERKIDCFIDLHVRAVTSLTREFAIRFMKRGSGRILNMSSM